MKGDTTLDFNIKARIKIHPTIKPLAMWLLFWISGVRNFSDRSSEKDATNEQNNRSPSLISKIPPARLDIKLNMCNASEISGLRKKIQAKKTANCVYIQPNGIVMNTNFLLLV